MKKYLPILALLFFTEYGISQVATGSAKVKILKSDQTPIDNATVLLLNPTDSLVIKIQVTDSAGVALFLRIPPGNYLLKASHVGWNDYISTTPFSINKNEIIELVGHMDSLAGYLKEVTVKSRKPFIKLETNKTVINMEAGITNIGASALEALEKLPGISIDRNGGIALKGKPGVLILIDGKQTYLGNSELATFLSGLSSDQISEIEIIEHPSSKYEAAGNAGIINIKTKKSTRQGIFGSISSTYAQARYPKNNNGLIFNIHKGAVNFFLNYNLNQFSTYSTLYAYRKYLETDNKTVHSILAQDLYLFTKGYTHTFRCGADYTLSRNASLGVTFNGISLSRNTNGTSVARWENDQNRLDSSLFTSTGNHTIWKNNGVSFNYHQKLSKSAELNTDIDMPGYKIIGTSLFQNSNAAGGAKEIFVGNLPGKLHIISAKSDFSKNINNNTTLEAGWKSSHINTDNLAAYLYDDGTGLRDDLEKSNHFLYTENNHAIYSEVKIKNKKWSLNGGLRYEHTQYKGHQLGNSVIKDTVFTKKYNSVFPNFMISYSIDSLNELSINVDRRIDRPPYQKLNPFVFIINKYTYQLGNPSFLPQFTWSATISHNYKGLLVSNISYSKISNYFSQLFYSNPSGLVIYTEGNVGTAQDLGISVSLQLNLFKWWNFTTAASVDYKTIRGKVVNELYSSITQMTFNINNQFQFGDGWAAEISGYYNTKSQTDIQEVLDPAGQLAAGVSKLLFKNKVTIKLGVRDIFHTQIMKGLTQFQFSNEYFRETRDSRMVTISASYRFGKTSKSNRQSGGAAEEEINRVGTGS